MISTSNGQRSTRTPLNAVLGFAQLMERDPSVLAAHGEHLTIIRRSGEHLLELINDVLELSRIEAGGSILNAGSFDLHHALDDVVEMVRVRTENKGLQLIFERAPNVPRYVSTDERKLRQVLINLLDNGFKFTEQGGVTLRVRSREYKVASTTASNLHFEVEDTGAGIAPEEMDQLFEAFAQTESGQRARQGTGLGLPISRQFVRLMGGEITVRSQVGRGTCFSFDLRVEPATAAEGETQRLTRQVIGLEANQHAPDGGPYRILIAEDRLESRILLRELLEAVGFFVREAANGQEAVELYASWRRT